MFGALQASISFAPTFVNLFGVFCVSIEHYSIFIYLLQLCKKIGLFTT